MDSNPTLICRLCLLTSDDAVNIWETFEDSSIASILEKHFWFQVHKNDGLTEWLCQMCWVQTKSFHEFYAKVERYHKYLLDSVETDIGEPDAVVDIRAGVSKSDLNIVKCEETELALMTIGTDIRNDDSMDSDIDDCNQIETEDISSQPSVKKLKVNDEDLSETEKLLSQIRDVFAMKCEICSNVQFESLSEVKNHYRMVHKRKGYLACCCKKFWDLAQILDHIRYHKTPRIEGENAQIRELFNMKCEVCSDVEFITFLDARRHYRILHKTKGFLMCCGKKFYHRSVIRNHLLNHTNPDAFRCEECGKICRTKITLKMHIANHVPLDSRVHKCSLCASSFSKKSVLKEHIKNKHTSKTGEKFPCDKCGKSFRSKLLLSSHNRYVHNSLEHVCETCARRFKTKQLLANHVVTQHSTTPPPKVQCDICGTWLKHKLYLQKHITLMHGDAKANAVNCPICKKLVKNKGALNSHMNHVHRERRHKCTFCDKAFKCAKILREHVAGHTGEDLYDCPYCEKKFKSNANMYSHRKKAHLAEWTRDSTQ